MTDLVEVEALVAGDHGLAVVAVTRADGTVSSSVVNAGVLDHPVTGERVLGFVVRGDTRKRAYLRARPRATVTLRAGWRWASVEGATTLVGPDDPLDGVDAERLRVLLRDVFTASGGVHDDWETYDRVMADERRLVVLVRPERIYSNP